MEREARQRRAQSKPSAGCASPGFASDRICSPPVPSALSLVQGQAHTVAGCASSRRQDSGNLQQCQSSSAGGVAPPPALPGASMVQRPAQKLQLPDSQQSTLTAVHPDADRAASHGAASTSGRLQDTASRRAPAPASAHHQPPAARSLPSAPAPAGSSGQQARPQHQQGHGVILPHIQPLPLDAELCRRAEALQRAGLPPWAAPLSAQPCARPGDVHARARAFAQLLPRLAPPPPSHAACVAAHCL